MKRLISRLPHTWQRPASQIFDYALNISPRDYTVNAFIAPFIGWLMLAFIVINQNLIATLLVAFGALNLLMAVAVTLYRLANR